MCANATSMLNDKRVKLTCNISTPAGLEHIGCNKVFWELPEIQVKIPTLGDTSVRRKKTQNMDILEGSCLVSGRIIEPRHVISNNVAF